ncbi:hypothetical protein FHS31_000795 [Sphingomonas vulcanisoli]|uniref:CopG family transcriptional regulator n=1 Tax=Sphingomonas vulcanisoli TaxID=1658060 RepID=A0ABX0TR40_9SPHN|nr:hypothetical protein [Sphingomonas vulcanisoli]NIJ07199.1 hypothetical protein [Sphingomonas vulcanisoli]
MKRRYTTVEVEISDVIDDLTNDDVREMAAARGISVGIPSFDLIEEIRLELLRGKAQAALALIDSHQNAQRIPEAHRQHQFQLTRLNS